MKFMFNFYITYNLTIMLCGKCGQLRKKNEALC